MIIQLKIKIENYIKINWDDQERFLKYLNDYSIKNKEFGKLFKDFGNNN